jgi:hypothetical protein
MQKTGQKRTGVLVISKEVQVWTIAELLSAGVALAVTETG